MSLESALGDLPEGWREKLVSVGNEPFFKDLGRFLTEQYTAEKIIYPASGQLFRALAEVDLPRVKVVILGQDPYHGEGQAIGLSFAVPNELAVKPPSLQNIFKELQADLNVTVEKKHSDLSGWVRQGVLLLNTVLTVEKDKPLSHRDRGWELFTDRVIACLNERLDPIVFILWGNHAAKFKNKIDVARHTVLESAHPSPLSAYRGFFGSRVFSRANEVLRVMGKDSIQWQEISDSGC